MTAHMLKDKLFRALLIATVIIAVLYYPFRYAGNAALEAYMRSPSFGRLPVSFTNALLYLSGNFLRIITSYIFTVILALILFGIIRLSFKKAILIWTVYAAAMLSFYLLFGSSQWRVYDNTLFITDIAFSLISIATTLILFIAPKLFKKVAFEPARFCLSAFTYLVFKNLINFILSLPILFMQDTLSQMLLQKNLLYYLGSTTKSIIKSMVVIIFVYGFILLLPRLKRNKTVLDSPEQTD